MRKTRLEHYIPTHPAHIHEWPIPLERQQQRQGQCSRGLQKPRLRLPAPCSDSAQQFLPALPTTPKRRHHDHSLRIPTVAAAASSWAPISATTSKPQSNNVEVVIGHIN
ncbi:hypothetical protein BC936DRAFT_148213 [Jimgerdemannia flammicorona]|uniref:Uncharacterized protein n=1 Tax=Jimgerdemannia flammicorona TaxID=994334 RepID=A0A433D3I2_9FUNG|nr:hypothetical protein BC936DRAFT_148213 [Jimgerdemannia flammicorona]